MLSFAVCRLYRSIRKQRLQLLRQVQNPAQVQLLESITEAEASSIRYAAKADSDNEALKGVLFSVWSCVLATCQIKQLRSIDLSKKFAKIYVVRVLIRWKRYVKKVHNRVKCAQIVARRARFSLAKCCLRRWSGAYFTYSAFLKIRMCRSKRVFQRVCRARLVRHWTFGYLKVSTRSIVFLC